ncbi:hypothetical protein FXO38_18372 [Capsicum annuum]|uniref:Uncharacterized protein n=1 Tax=Capsicum annuum TaxID=4072 RepID=A0A2G2Z1G7_CAPAN|nr:hypothetical protein FXO38_18372 [Capsicum annuum]PHT75829.1 hypothetical protein T459_19351 [Capsicum annuum]
MILTVEEQASAKKDEEAYLKNSLKKFESEVTYLKEVLGEAKNEGVRFQKRLMAKEKEVQNIICENTKIQSREPASLKKFEELSVLFEESLAKNEPEASVELSDSEKDYYMHPKIVKFSDQIEKPNMELSPYQSEQVKKLNEHENIAKEDDDESYCYENGGTSSIKQQNQKKKKKKPIRRRRWKKNDDNKLHERDI